MSFDPIRFWLEPRWKYLLAGVVIPLLLIVGFVFRERIVGVFQSRTVIPETAEVTVPTIINGELVLPKVSTASADQPVAKDRLGVASANLVGIFKESAATSSPTLAGIRVIGEAVNLGTKIVNGLSPVVKFIDKDGKTIAQKIAHLTPGFTFFDLPAGGKTLYDVTVDDPPSSDRLEISLNPSSFADKAVYEPFKIASQSMEIKTATYQGNSQQATEAGSAEKVQYYSVAGSVVNTLSDLVSDITIYSWARNKEGEVFAFSRQDFKNDLLTAGDKIDFRILLLPLKIGEEYDSYEVAAWGKRYRLNL